jgi:hypothetical protein
MICIALETQTQLHILPSSAPLTGLSFKKSKRKYIIRIKKAHIPPQSHPPTTIACVGKPPDVPQSHAFIGPKSLWQSQSIHRRMVQKTSGEIGMHDKH